MPCDSSVHHLACCRSTKSELPVSAGGRAAGGEIKAHRNGSFACRFGLSCRRERLVQEAAPVPNARVGLNISPGAPCAINWFTIVLLNTRHITGAAAQPEALAGCFSAPRSAMLLL
uniref:Uncharacterized protein n=1 Tax=Knipowitschia caucasica TaxID=637954 RepID=A0AAV2MR98_KNICA